MKKSELRQIIREEIQRLTEYRVDEEIPYTIDKLKKIYSMGYGAVVIAKGGGYSDVIEFGPNMREASFVKKVLEKNNLDVVIKKAKLDLKYAIEPKLKSKGRKLFIRITEPPITKVKEEFNMKKSELRQIIREELQSLMEKKSIEDMTKDAARIKKELADAKRAAQKSPTETNKAKVAAKEEQLKRVATAIRNARADQAEKSRG